jgi:hypothetical protein
MTAREASAENEALAQTLAASSSKRSWFGVSEVPFGQTKVSAGMK